MNQNRKTNKCEEMKIVSNPNISTQRLTISATQTNDQHKMVSFNLTLSAVEEGQKRYRSKMTART